MCVWPVDWSRVPALGSKGNQGLIQLKIANQYIATLFSRMGEIREGWELLVRVGVVIVVHFILAILLLVLIWVLQQVYLLLWGANDILLYDYFPLKWLIQTLDIAVIVIFLIKGTKEVHKAYEKK